MQYSPQHYVSIIVVTLMTISGCNAKSSQQQQAASLPSAAATDIGFVLEVEGDWVLEGKSNTPIKPGDRLPSRGFVVRAPNSTGKGKILVSLCTGDVLTIEDKRFELPKRVDPERISRVWSLASKRYHSEVISAQSRGLDGNTLRDAVIPFADGILHVSPAFEKMAAGTYHLRLEPIHNGETGETPKVVLLNDYEWVPSTAPTVNVASVPLGTYELHATKDGISDPETSAFVVICAPGAFEQLDKEARLAYEFVASWGDGASPHVKRRFIQSALASLADEIGTTTISK